MAGLPIEGDVDNDLEENPDNHNEMHKACISRRVKDVEALVKSHPDLCLQKDNNRRTPLEISVIDGSEDVVTALVTGCPESVQELTSNGDTLFQLSVKKGQHYCFERLMKVINSDNVKILNRSDTGGNTVLHNAVDQKMIRAVEMLLVNNFRSAPLVQIKAKNADGLTALQLFTKKNSTSVDSDIDKHILRLLLVAEAEAEAEEITMVKRSLQAEFTNLMNTSMIQNIFFVKITSLIAVIVFLGGITYSSLFNLGGVYLHLHPHTDNRTLSIGDIVSPPYPLPEVLHFLVPVKFAFNGCAGMLLKMTWSLGDRWSFWGRVLPIVLMAMVFFSFEVALNNLLPKFRVELVFSINISSFCFVLLWELLLFFATIFIWIVGEAFICCKRKMKTSGKLPKHSM